MKYIATINGKQYEVMVEKLDAYKSLDRDGVAAPVIPDLPKTAPVQRPAAPAPAAAPAPKAAAPAPAPAAATAPAAAPAPAAGGVKIDAPMPGKILKVNVQAGQSVKYGEAVIVMEAMKMETEIVAPQDGKVAQILVKAGDMVDTGAVLATLE